MNIGENPVCKDYRVRAVVELWSDCSGTLVKKRLNREKATLKRIYSDVT